MTQKDNTVKDIKPEQPPQQPQQQVPMMKCGVIPATLVQQLIDFIRDTPAPRKITDPLADGLAQCQYADFPMRNPDQQ